MSNFEMEALTRIAVALEKIAEAGITLQHAKPESDGREGEAVDFLKAHSTLTVENTEAGLAAIGIARGRKWVKQKKIELGLPVGRRPVRPKAEKPVDHHGLKIRDADYTYEIFKDESRLSAEELQKREAFAIEAIRQNPKATWIELWHYIREHTKCSLEKSEQWINSHRPTISP